jgi:hypothetical protein
LLLLPRISTSAHEKVGLNLQGLLKIRNRVVFLTDVIASAGANEVAVSREFAWYWQLRRRAKGRACIFSLFCFLVKLG